GLSRDRARQRDRLAGTRARRGRPRESARSRAGRPRRAGPSRRGRPQARRGGVLARPRARKDARHLPGAPRMIPAAGAFLIATAAVVLLRRTSLLDEVNERSLHTVPVPRLGGVGVALGALLMAVVAGVATPWLVCTALVSALGLVDDLRPLRAGLRFALQLAL